MNENFEITDKDVNQNSCLKFYAFLDDEDSTSVRLLLDHSLTENLGTQTVMIRQGFDIIYKKVLESYKIFQELYKTTSEWKGTLAPENYSCYNIDNIDATNGVIDYCNLNYGSYAARLITAEEVAEIIGYDDFKVDDPQPNNPDGIYLDFPNFVGDSRPQGTFKYGWLYDRTAVPEESSDSYGIPNYEICSGECSDNLINGYWTPSLNSENFYWSVNAKGSLLILKQDLSIRPVIEVSKALLQG